MTEVFASGVESEKFWSFGVPYSVSAYQPRIDVEINGCECYHITLAEQRKEHVKSLEIHSDALQVFYASIFQPNGSLLISSGFRRSQELLSFYRRSKKRATFTFMPSVHLVYLHLGWPGTQMVLFSTFEKCFHSSRYLEAALYLFYYTHRFFIAPRPERPISIYIYSNLPTISIHMYRPTL